MQKRIWVAAKDRGGLNGVLPVYRLLLQRGYGVQLFAEGDAAAALTGMHENFVLAPNAEAALQPGDRPDLLLTSMDHGDHLGRNLIPLLRGTGTVTVALQDYWGGEIVTGWADLKYRPDFICVNDAFGAALVRRAWPDFDPLRTKITGFPALDKYAGVRQNLATVNAEVRANLGISESDKVVLYAGQWWHSGRMLQEVVRALNAIPQPICLIARQHPGMLRNAPDQLPLWEQALASLKTGRVVSTESFQQITPLIVVANVVCGMYTTVLQEACCLWKPNISILYPDGGLIDFRRETGGLMNYPPIVELSCSVRVERFSQLQVGLSDALNGWMDLSAAQARFFPADGENAEKAADFLASVLN